QANENVSRKQWQLQPDPAVLPLVNCIIKRQKIFDAAPRKLFRRALLMVRARVRRIPERCRVRRTAECLRIQSHAAHFKCISGNICSHIHVRPCSLLSPDKAPPRDSQPPFQLGSLTEKPRQPSETSPPGCRKLSSPLNTRGAFYALAFCASLTVRRERA